MSAVSFLSYFLSYRENALQTSERNAGALSLRCWVLWAFLLRFGRGGTAAEPQSGVQVQSLDIAQTNGAASFLKIRRLKMRFSDDPSPGLYRATRMSCAWRRMTPC